VERGACLRGVSRLLVILPFFLSGRCFAQTYNGFNYTNNGTAVTITGYGGPGGAVTIPSSIPGVGTVASIGNSAFDYCSFTSVTIPSSVTNIGTGALYYCSSLTNVTIPSNVISSNYSGPNWGVSVG
jgi:hypothetical protein